MVRGARKLETARTDVATSEGGVDNGEPKRERRAKDSKGPFRVPDPALRSWLDQVIIPILVKEVLGD